MEVAGTLLSIGPAAPTYHLEESGDQPGGDAAGKQTVQRGRLGVLVVRDEAGQEQATERTGGADGAEDPDIVGELSAGLAGPLRRVALEALVDGADTDDRGDLGREQRPVARLPVRRRQQDLAHVDTQQLHRRHAGADADAGRRRLRLSPLR